MLTYLQIRDFAIVEQLELEFAPGMSAITGETGAGKSIMVDALGLLLGDRAESGAVRFGAERAEISASFDLSAVPEARAWLAERDLASAGGDDCHVRRLIYGNGRSRAYINGVLQPLAALKELGELLVDIHSQHEHQSLLKHDLQRQLLDDYAGHLSLLKHDLQRQLLDDYGGHRALLTQLAAAYNAWLRLCRQLEQLQRASHEQDARLDLLQFQVQELQALGLGPDEVAQLEHEHKRLANAERLLDVAQRALNQLYESEEISVHSVLSKQLAELEALSAVDEALQAASELLSGALIQVEEASDALRRYLQDIDLDPSRLQWVEQRLAVIYQLARKHRIEPAALPERLLELHSELTQLANSEQHLDSLQRQIEAAWQTYARLAENLSAQRRAAAAELGTQVSAAMQELGMAGGRFEVKLTKHEQPSVNGAENVDFLVSANPGQPLKPLAKVASGGELSRISLAIQVIAADSARIPTLIFDEVDAGIGGAVAEVVGRQLRQIGRRRQVLCVTHLPQVAAQAHRQFKVDKQSRADTTRTEVLALDGRQRLEEIARMLGGVKLTKNTLAHAREMIERAQTEL